MTFPNWIYWELAVVLCFTLVLFGSCARTQRGPRHGFFDSYGKLCADQTKPCV